MSDENRQLVVVEHESLEELELADENMIVAEMEGRVSDKFIYELKGVRDEKGQPVIGLSYPGTNWACREYAKQGESIRVMGDKPEIMRDPIDPQYIIAVVRAQRFAIDPKTNQEVPLDSTFGIKRQCCMMKKKKYDGSGNVVGDEAVPDPFFYEKAVSKAIRNAKQNLIPTDTVKRLITKAIEARNKPGRGGAPPPAKPAATKSPQPAAAAPVQPPPEPDKKETPKQEPAPQAAPPSQQKPNKDMLVQKFEVVLKKALGLTDGILARQQLKVWCGTDKITDLGEEDLMKYGRILQEVIKGKNKISEDKSRIINGEGKVLWGKEEQPAAPPAQPAKPEEPKPPAPAPDKDYF